MDEDIYEVVLHDAYFKWLCGIIGCKNIDYSEFLRSICSDFKNRFCYKTY